MIKGTEKSLHKRIERRLWYAMINVMIIPKYWSDFPFVQVSNQINQSLWLGVGIGPVTPVLSSDQIWILEWWWFNDRTDSIPIQREIVVNCWNGNWFYELRYNRYHFSYSIVSFFIYLEKLIAGSLKLLLCFWMQNRIIRHLRFIIPASFWTSVLVLLSIIYMIWSLFGLRLMPEYCRSALTPLSQRPQSPMHGIAFTLFLMNLANFESEISWSQFWNELMPWQPCIFFSLVY